MICYSVIFININFLIFSLGGGFVVDIAVLVSARSGHSLQGINRVMVSVVGHFGVEVSCKNNEVDIYFSVLKYSFYTQKQKKYLLRLNVIVCCCSKPPSKHYFTGYIL